MLYLGCCEKLPFADQQQALEEVPLVEKASTSHASGSCRALRHLLKHGPPAATCNIHRSQPPPTPLHTYANKHNTAAATVTLPHQELCEGGDWFDQLLGGGAFSEAQAARAIRSVLKTLSYCHSLGVAHRQAWGQAYHGMEKDCVAFH